MSYLPSIDESNCIAQGDCAELLPQVFEVDDVARVVGTGPAGARRALAEHGGLVVHEHGEVESIGPIDDGEPAALALGRAA